MTEKNKGGHPPLFKTPEAFKKKADEYFESDEVKTVTGLALFLGFADRQSLYDTEKRRGFSCVVKRARLQVENEYEKRLIENGCTGSIFALKNMGWKDRPETKTIEVPEDYTFTMVVHGAKDA